MTTADANTIALMRVAVHVQCKQQFAIPAQTEIELNAPQFTDNANLYLRHLGKWPELLGVKEVRVHIGGPYRWPTPKRKP